MPPYPVEASGHTSVILLLNMRRFVPEEARGSFESLRGTETLHQAIQNWAQEAYKQDVFIPLPQLETGGETIDADTMTAEEIGFATGVFRSIARERFFSPTYRVNKEAFSFPPELLDNLQFKRLFLHVWKRWEIYIRPGMSGFFLVRLTWHYLQPRSLLEIARETHRLQAPFDVPSALEWLERARREYSNDPQRLQRTERSIGKLLEWLGVGDHRATLEKPIYYPVQWRLAMEVIQRFVESFPLRIPASQGEICLRPSPITPSIPLHDLYVLHYLEHLYVDPTVLGRNGMRGSKIEVPVQVIRDSKIVRNGLTSLLEGSLLRPIKEASEQGREDMPYEFPSPRWSLADGLPKHNLASWSDEFCVLAPRAGIIIPSSKYREFEMGVSTLPRPTLKVYYRRYWEAIERMVEFVFEARVLAQLIESDSYRLLQEMANKIEKVREDMYRGNVSVDAELKDHSIRAAHLMRLAALVQSLTHPFFWSRAEYAARKAEFLLEALDMPHIFEHIQRNIEGITNLASHIDEIYIADLAEKSNKRATFLSVLLAAASLALVWLVLPSFLQDWWQYFKEGAVNRYIFYLYNFMGILLAAAMIYFSFRIIVKAICSPSYRIHQVIDELFK